ncbi:MAG TPA: hypothetical protein VKG26_02330 [Bacteroidia bacterium]|nr:hypothetical protein [Bacteroidia bacterium]
MDILKDFFITFSLPYKENQKELATNLVFNLFLAVYPIERDKIHAMKKEFYKQVSYLLDMKVSLESQDILNLCLLEPVRKKLFEEGGGNKV